MILPNTHRFGYSMHDATHKFTFVYFSRTAQTEFIPSHQIWWPPGGYLPVVLLHSYGQQHNTDCPAGRELSCRLRARWRWCCCCCCWWSEAAALHAWDSHRQPNRRNDQWVMSVISETNWSCFPYTWTQLCSWTWYPKWLALEKEKERGTEHARLCVPLVIVSGWLIRIVYGGYAPESIATMFDPCWGQQTNERIYWLVNNMNGF